MMLLQTSELIRAVGSLWLLAFFVFLTVAIVLFRQPIIRLLGRFRTVKWKRGRTEAEVELDKEPIETGGEVKDEPEDEALEETGPPALEEPKPPEPSELFGEMWDAFLQGRARDAMDAFNRLQEAEAEENDKLFNRCWYLYLSYKHAQRLEALDELRELAGRHREIAPLALSLVGQALEASGEFDQAANAFIEASEAADQREDESSAVRSVSQASRLMTRDDQGREALDFLAAQIRQRTDAGARATLYEAVADVYEEIGERWLRTIALERAVQFRPNHPGLLFKAGWAHDTSDPEGSILALLHYVEVRSYQPDHASATNNLGVEYERLRMPGKSVAMYRDAMELGHTLAMANLAYRYMRGGFLDEAHELLKTAMREEDPHPNVASAFQEHSQTTEKEGKTESELLSNARDRQSTLREFAEAFFEGPDGHLVGEWADQEGFLLTIEAKGDQVLCRLRSAEEEEPEEYVGVTRNRAVFLPESELGKPAYVYLLPDERLVAYVPDISGYEKLLFARV